MRFVLRLTVLVFVLAAGSGSMQAAGFSGVPAPMPTDPGMTM